MAVIGALPPVETVGTNDKVCPIPDLYGSANKRLPSGIRSLAGHTDTVLDVVGGSERIIVGPLTGLPASPPIGIRKTPGFCAAAGPPTAIASNKCAGGGPKGSHPSARSVPPVKTGYLSSHTSSKRHSL